MSRKDFIALAATVRDFNHHEQTNPFTSEHIGAIADFCQTQNPRFDRDRFISACEGK